LEEGLHAAGRITLPDFLTWVLDFPSRNESTSARARHTSTARRASRSFCSS
jgi:hypothetical protein